MSEAGRPHSQVEEVRPAEVWSKNLMGVGLQGLVTGEPRL